MKNFFKSHNCKAVFTADYLCTAHPSICTDAAVGICDIKDSDALICALTKHYGEGTRVVTSKGEGALSLIAGESDCVVLPPSLTERTRYTMGDLMTIMDILMSEQGCPWDRVQTHQTIKKNLLEEAQEAVDAIDNNDLDNMCEEFGDVLLQSVFQSRIAEKNRTFSFDDVVTRLCRKLITRHTHVFGGGSADSPEQALDSWKAAKKREKGNA